MMDIMNDNEERWAVKKCFWNSKKVGKEGARAWLICTKCPCFHHSRHANAVEIVKGCIMPDLAQWTLK
jgi:hypothetical protein